MAGALRAVALLGYLAWSGLSLAEDWPEFMGPRRDQTSVETGLINGLPKQGLRLIFERKIGPGYSAPSIRGKVMVVHHRIGDEEIVEACEAANGKTIWKHSYPSTFRDPFGYNNGPRCSPLLTAEHCYTFGAEGILLCLDLKDGRVLWRRATQSDWDIPEAFFGVGSSPVLADGLLIVQLGGQSNSGVVAFDAATGKTVWENVGEKTWTGVPMTRWPGERLVSWSRADPAFEKQASYCSPVLATVHGESYLFVVTRQGLVALEPKTGAHRFSYWFRARQDSSVNAMTPVVSGDLVLLSSAYFKNGSVLLRVRPDGRGVDEVWRSLALEMHWTRPVLDAGHLYAFSGRNEPDARFRCVEFATGKVCWDRAEGWPNAGHAKLIAGEAAPNVFGRGSALLADGKLIALGEAGLLGLFRPTPERLEELGRWQVPGLTYPCWVAPVLAAGCVYLRDEARVACYDLRK